MVILDNYKLRKFKMAQKKKQKVVIKKESDSKGKNILSRSNVLVMIIILIIVGFFVVNNFIEKNEPEVEYYTFKKEGELTFTDSLGNTKTKIDLKIDGRESGNDFYFPPGGISIILDEKHINSTRYDFREQRSEDYYYS